MASTRVWLTDWEWDCCGDPFTVGDRVSFTVLQPPGDWLAELLGPDLSRDVAAEETHHEEPGPEILTGTVTAIHGVTIDHSEHRELRANPAPPPEPQQVGDGWVAMGPREPYVTVSTPIPGTARLHRAPRVPWPPRYDEPEVDPPVPQWLTGYLVELDIE